VPEWANQVWSADFMSDALYQGPRFRIFNVIDDYNREVLAIEIDTSLRADRIRRVLDRIEAERSLPDVLRVDNGPEFLSQVLADWAKEKRVLIQHIQPGKPNQNAYIERFNRTYRNEVLDLYLFRNLDEVQEITSRWLVEYNEQRPHDALGGLPPAVYANQRAGNSTAELSD
jgi:putative transposase